MHTFLPDWFDGHWYVSRMDVYHHLNLLYKQSILLMMVMLLLPILDKQHDSVLREHCEMVGKASFAHNGSARY